MEERKSAHKCPRCRTRLVETWYVEIVAGTTVERRRIGRPFCPTATSSLTGTLRDSRNAPPSQVVDVPRVGNGASESRGSLLSEIPGLHQVPSEHLADEGQKCPAGMGDTDGTRQPYQQHSCGPPQMCDAPRVAPLHRQAGNVAILPSGFVLPIIHS